MHPKTAGRGAAPRRPLPPLRRRPAAGAAIAVAAALLAGCAGPAADHDLAAARDAVRARGGPDVAWLTTADARARARADVDAALDHPLSADDAVRLALAADPALQAVLADGAAASADATRAARPANPVFEFERVAGGGQLEVTRALLLPLVDLVLWPARAAQADDAHRRVRLRLASDVLRHADTARRAWIDAVAADASLAQASRVQDAAEAGATLARRMAERGNWSALQRAREEQFAVDAAQALAQAKRRQRATREALVRALGLDDAQAARLQLPAHLPAPPDTLPDAASARAAMQAALDDRLDVQRARAELDATARAQGVARVESVAGRVDLGPAQRAETGLPREKGLSLSVAIPVFDLGDATRTAAAARVAAARSRVEATAVAAASQLREADGDRRDAWALARHQDERLVPLHATLLREDLLRYNGMLASVFDLLADARAQADAVARAEAARRDYWRADAAWQAALAGTPAPSSIPSDIAPETAE